MSNPPRLVAVAPDAFDRDARAHDALIVVAPSPLSRQLAAAGLPATVTSAIEAALAVDEGVARGVRLPAVIPAPAAPGGRVVLAPMGALTDDTDDVRHVAETTAAAVARAVDAGARRPLLAV